MAGADYKACDLCKRKTFYDVDVNYEWDEHKGQDVPQYVGDWKVICIDCAKTHECVIVEREKKAE